MSHCHSGIALVYCNRGHCAHPSSLYFCCLLTMSDFRAYSKEFVLEFIDLWKSHTALWKVKSASYSNKNIKLAAYEAMVNKLREVDSEATFKKVKNIKKRINSLRTNFRRELRKINDSKRFVALLQLCREYILVKDYLSF